MVALRSARSSIESPQALWCRLRSSQWWRSTGDARTPRDWSAISSPLVWGLRGGSWGSWRFHCGYALALVVSRRSAWGEWVSSARCRWRAVRDWSRRGGGWGCGWRIGLEWAGLHARSKVSLSHLLSSIVKVLALLHIYPFGLSIGWSIFFQSSLLFSCFRVIMKWSSCWTEIPFRDTQNKSNDSYPKTRSNRWSLPNIVEYSHYRWRNHRG